jgi:ABC-type dipeptide/oligopeptide/nickel transport system permease subunit
MTTYIIRRILLIIPYSPVETTKDPFAPPSWGDILSEARVYIDFAWWLAFFPGLAILITIMSYNYVGEGLRDAVDPRLCVK